MLYGSLQLEQSQQLQERAHKRMQVKWHVCTTVLLAVLCAQCAGAQVLLKQCSMATVQRGLMHSRGWSPWQHNHMQGGILQGHGTCGAYCMLVMMQAGAAAVAQLSARC